VEAVVSSRADETTARDEVRERALRGRRLLLRASGILVIRLTTWLVSLTFRCWLLVEATGRITPGYLGVVVSGVHIPLPGPG
jgi:hypothetical protein